MNRALDVRIGRSPLLLLTLFGLALPSAFGCTTGSQGKLVHTDDGFRLTESGPTRLGTGARFRQATDSLAAENLDTAIAEFEAAIEAAPHHAAPRVNLSIALRQANRLEEAADALRAALEIHPRHVVAHNELGIVYRKLGQFEAARESYERAIALYNDFHPAHRNLGVLCDLFLEDSQCALTHYRRYSEIAPEDTQPAIWIADLEQRIAQPQ